MNLAAVFRTARIARLLAAALPSHPLLALGPAPFRGAPHEPPRRERVPGGIAFTEPSAISLADQQPRHTGAQRMPQQLWP